MRSLSKYGHDQGHSQGSGQVKVLIMTRALSKSRLTPVVMLQPRLHSSLCPSQGYNQVSVHVKDTIGFLMNQSTCPRDLCIERRCLTLKNHSLQEQLIRARKEASFVKQLQHRKVLGSST
jgi:hypothetical protein